ncbi:hypothetical protein ACICHK_36600 [Streptomyces sp. AHU1]|uniref:hypothetical protein n=1 Tax=Streptomyces sp. AHU1 TaxID=3377215 RepID=UPI003877C43A
MAGTTGNSARTGRNRTEAAASGQGAAPGEGAVFVDESGRRRSWLRSMGWVVAVSCVCFATALAALVSGGDSAAPWLHLPDGAREAHKDVSARRGASRVEERPTGAPAPSPVGRESAAADPPGPVAGPVTPPTADAATGRRADATGTEDGPPRQDAIAAPSPSPSPSAASPSARTSAAPPRVAPAVPADGTSGSPSPSSSPSPSPSGSSGEATRSPAPEPSGDATGEAA